MLVANSETADGTGGRFTLRRGFSRNISRDGLCFVCAGRLTERNVCLHLEEHPNTGSPFFAAEIVKSKDLGDGRWEYGVVFRESFAES